MKNKIITISRQFGSGGRSVGKLIARELGCEYYDKEIVDKVAEETGFDPKFVEERGEYAPSKSKLAYAFSPMGALGIMDGKSPNDYIWHIQSDFINKIAEKDEPCVIVGRCADFILKDREDCLHVFIYADNDYRADRIVRLYGSTDRSPDKRLAEKDKKRAVNYNFYTGRVWGDPRNYDICLNSGKLGEEKCAEIIIGLIKDGDGG